MRSHLIGIERVRPALHSRSLFVTAQAASTLYVPPSEAFADPENRRPGTGAGLTDGLIGQLRSRHLRTLPIL